MVAGAVTRRSPRRNPLGGPSPSRLGGGGCRWLVRPVRPAGPRAGGAPRGTVTRRLRGGAATACTARVAQGGPGRIRFMLLFPGQAGYAVRWAAWGDRGATEGRGGLRPRPPASTPRLRHVRNAADDLRLCFRPR